MKQNQNADDNKQQCPEDFVPLPAPFTLVQNRPPFAFESRTQNMIITDGCQSKKTDRGYRVTQKGVLPHKKFDFIVLYLILETLPRAQKATIYLY
jgi:hypothetical protein